MLNSEPEGQSSVSFFGVCAMTEAVRLSATFLAIPAEEDKDEKVLFHTDSDFTCRYFFL